MPAAIMWARGLDDRPVDARRSTSRPARAGRSPRSCTPAATPLEFTAPNLQYLMDSPAEFGPIADARSSSVGRAARSASRCITPGTDAELDGFVKDVEKIVRQEGAIFGEYPGVRAGLLHVPRRLPAVRERRRHGAPQQHGDHRRRCRLRRAATDLLDTVAHEFFHCWNVERIRPQSLEPFDFDRANMSGELWLAEGFTQYYGPLALQRARLVGRRVDRADADRPDRGGRRRPGTCVRSAEEMSRMAPFIDGGRTIDRTNWSTTVISYYPFGGAIALALDLTLRDRTDGRVSLDDFMRAMWRSYGKPGGAREGYVDRPVHDRRRRGDAG